MAKIRVFKTIPCVMSNDRDVENYLNMQTFYPIIAVGLVLNHSLATDQSKLMVSNKYIHF